MVKTPASWWIAGIGAMVLISCVSSQPARAQGVSSPAQNSDRESPANVSLDPANVHGRNAAHKATAGHQEMLDLLKSIIDRTPNENIYLGDGQLRHFQGIRASLSPASPDAVKCRLFAKLGVASQNLGHERDAIDYFSKCYELLPKLKSELPPSVVEELVFRLGVAYLRLGETQNCCLRNQPESCILPIRGGGIHTEKEGSTRASRYFTELLGIAPEGSPMHLRARWLLNIAHMTLGTHPNGVPESHQIGSEAFRSDEEFPRFHNVAGRLGLATNSNCGGAIADDFDNDGYLDLIVSTWDTAGQIRYFRNERDGTFAERTTEAGMAGIFGGLNLVQADYDNDGDVDVLVLRGGWWGRAGQHPNSLLQNSGDGTFRDVTFAAGLAELNYPTQTASWADYDNDGDLDLYVGNESTRLLSAPSQLFRNDGDGTFTDVARRAGVTNDRFTKAVVWGDYNGDRLPDLYVSNHTGFNRLYRNNGDGSFTDVAPDLGVAGPYKSFPAWFWDFDNDGVLDIYASAYAAGIEDVAASYQGLPTRVELARLYHGDGDGGFEDVAERRGLGRPNFPMGANFGDLDNDGYLDFYLGTGDTDYWSLTPNVMYRNQAGAGFADVTAAGGFGKLQKGHAVVFADFDHDGDQDIFEQMGGAFPGDKFNDSFFENPGFGNHWITVEVVGVRTNRSAIGVRLRVVVTEGGHNRSIYKHVNSGGSFGANPLRQTIGLGEAAEIERLELYWPTTGQTQIFKGLPLDQHIQVVEGQDEYSILNLPVVRLGSLAARAAQ